ncbi:MAG TPA: hypothetical protein VFT72_13085 [Opitutaceae bacterium]|nr:hypothetical protein [Opitutaceae bacterium]
MPVRDDYLLRFVNLLREALAEAVRLRKGGRHEQALLVIIQTQEKLFVRPAAEFIRLNLDQQIELLRRGEKPSDARTKLLAYASLMREAGEIYAARDRADLAAGAFQAALHVSLVVANEDVAPDENLRTTIGELLKQVPPEQLQPPVVEMLQRLPNAGEI